MRRGIAVAGTLLILGLGAIGAVQKPWSEGVAPEILDWAEGAIESWLDAAEQNSDTTCAAGAQAALDGLAISNAWLWTDEDLTDADGNPTDALTELNDPDAVKEWVDSGKTDTSFPGGDLTKLDVTVYGEKEGDGWRIKPSGHLAFTIAHEALHWLPGGGPNHTLAAFTQLENCHIKEEEEEDDDEPGEGGGESTETCEDVWRPALTTTVPVWVVPTDCNDNEDEAETCDFETGICTGMRLHVCPGKWVDQVVVLRDGYMERVCTSN